jgi:hypothetical protein
VEEDVFVAAVAQDAAHLRRRVRETRTPSSSEWRYVPCLWFRSCRCIPSGKNYIAWRGARRRAVAREWVSWRCCEDEDSRCWLRRLRLGRAGEFEGHGLCCGGAWSSRKHRSVAGCHLSTDRWGQSGSFLKN